MALQGERQNTVEAAFGNKDSDNTFQPQDCGGAEGGGPRLERAAGYLASSGQASLCCKEGVGRSTQTRS